MNVQFLDLGAAYRELQPEIDAAVHRVLASGQYILGEELEAFEAEWAAFCGATQAVGVGNGLDALILATARREAPAPKPTTGKAPSVPRQARES